MSTLACDSCGAPVCFVPKSNATLLAECNELLAALKALIVDFDRVRAIYLSGGSVALDEARRVAARFKGGK